MDKETVRQSGRWLLSDLYWGGFGSVAAVLSSALASLNALYAIARALYLMPQLRVAILPVYNWFVAQKLNFGQSLVVSAALAALAILQPKIYMQKIGAEVLEESKRVNSIKNMLHIRNVLIVYTVVASLVGALLFYGL
jgi:hypothetical protein